LPGGSLWGAAGLAALQTGFFMAQWQEYHTGVLRTSFGPVGVTEVQFSLMAGASVAGLVGPERLRSWIHSKTLLPWSQEALPHGIILIQGWTVFMAVLMLISIAKTLNTAHQNGGTSGIFSATLQLTPIVALDMCLFFVWDASAYSLCARKVCFLTGILFFFYTAQMILFSMAKMRFPEFQLGTLAPYAALALSSRILSNVQIDIALTVASVLAGVWVLLWLCRVVSELKEKLGIYAFTLQKFEQKKSD